jgi:hypothetical protein
MSTILLEMLNPFISNDDEDESQMPPQTLRGRSVMSSPPLWHPVRQKPFKDDDLNRIRSQSHKNKGSRDEAINGSANGLLPPHRVQSNPHFSTASKVKKDFKRGSDFGLSIEASSVQLTFPDDSRSKSQARGPPPLPPRYDDESSTSAPPLPIKGSKVSMQRQPIPLPKQPHRSKETSSSPSSPTIPPKPSFRTDGPQISPSVASSIAQIAAQAHRSAKNRQQALQPPSKPPLARKPNIQLTVSKWLADAGVPQHYADYLIQSGWDDPSFFNVISDNDLESVGITNREHRQRILEKARQR